MSRSSGAKITTAQLPLSVVSDSSRPGSAQGRGLAWNALTGKWADDVGAFSPRGERGIAVTNQVVDPRATTAGNWVASASGAGSVGQAMTQRTDGYQQQASSKSCMEMIATPAAAGTVTFASNLKANGNGVFVTAANPMIAVRGAFKILGTLGSGWTATLFVDYFSANGGFMSSQAIWTGGSAEITLGQWFTAEGFDSQMGLAAAYAEFFLQVSGATAGNPITIRGTEFVMAVDPDGDVPGYVGGDNNTSAAVSYWTGTADASTSVTTFDPVQTYPAKDIGASDAGALPGQGQYTVGQAVALRRLIGSKVARVGLPLSGGNPGAPSVPAATVTYLQALIAAGIKPILNVGAAPAWMSPTHMPTLAAAITTTNGTSITTSAAAPANITTPFDILINSERMTVTAGATTTTWIVTRGVGGTTAATHASTAQISDFLFNAAYGHYYYPDAAYRSLYAQAITNVIATLGAANVRGVEFWNEPNLAANDTRNEGPAGYTALLNAVYSAVKAVYPSVAIFGGVLAVQAASGAGVTLAETFLAGMVAAGAQFDYVDCHFYTSGTAQVGTSAPGTGVAGFDQSIKRIKDQIAASSIATPIYVSETGEVADQPDERRQAQTVALCFGRLWRDPQVAGIMNNGLVAPLTATTHGGGLFDAISMRPRASAHRIAGMNGMPRLPVDRDDPSLTTQLMPWFMTVVPMLAMQDAIYVQGTWTVNADSAAMLGGYIFQSPVAQYSEIAWDFGLAAGSYTFAIMFLKNVSYGIFTVLVDGVSIGTIDAYNATLTYNNSAKLNFTVARTGRHRLSFCAATKNASSTNYQLIAQMFQLRRTA